MDKEIVKTSLREVRKKRCFAIINRGALWYETLTPEQLTELREWYKQWLDVTATFKIPQTPKWLMEKGVVRKV